MNNVAIVSDLKVIDSPQAGLGVTRCLKQGGIDILGIDDTLFITKNKDLFIDTIKIEEIRNLNFDSLIKKLISFKEIYGAKYIFPCYDETAILFSLIKDKLDFIGYKTFVPEKDIFKKIGKINLHNLNINDDKYKTPETKYFNNINDGILWANQIGYPIVCKGLVKDAFICKNEQELLNNIEKISNIWNNGEISFLLQKYIKGTYKNSIIGINNNKIIGYAEISKIGIDSKGATWFGKLETTKDLFDLSKKLIGQLNFGSCIIEIETIEENGVNYIYEINPRSPAWLYSLSLAGLNLPILLVHNYSGDTKFISEEYYFGRETQEYILPITNISNENLDFYSKGAAYKNSGLKYPSELI